MLGRTSSGPHDVAKFDNEDDRYTFRLRFVEELLSLWWDLWFPQAFDLLFPLPKWKEMMPNLSPGDVCLLKYERKVG